MRRRAASSSTARTGCRSPGSQLPSSRGWLSSVPRQQMRTPTVHRALVHVHDCACFVHRSIADGKTHVLCSTFSRTLQPRPLQRALRADRRAHVVCLRRCLHDVDRPRCWHGHRRLVQRLAPAVLALLLLVGGRGSSRFLAGASEPLEVASALPMPTHTDTVRVIAMHMVQHVACSHRTPQHAPLRTAPARWFPTTGAAGSRAGTRPKTEVGCTGGAVDTRGCAGDEQTNRQADTTNTHTQGQP